MSLRVSNIRLGLDQPEAILPEKLAAILCVPFDILGPWRILRKSLDARDKDCIGFVYSVEVSLADEEAKVAQLAADCRWLRAGRSGGGLFPGGARLPPAPVGAWPAGS